MREGEIPEFRRQDSIGNILRNMLVILAIGPFIIFLREYFMRLPDSLNIQSSIL